MEDANLPFKAFSMSLVVIKKRFIYAIGFASYEITKKVNYEDLLILDTWNTELGWRHYNIKSELNGIGCQYGVFPLDEN